MINLLHQAYRLGVIIVRPCIPHEHKKIGRVERFNQTWENTVIKLLSNKPHLLEKYWAMVYKDDIMKSIILPISNSIKTPYQL